MKRKISERLAAWKARADHKPLIITGCRQIGKTYSVLEFVRENYSSYVYLNFEMDPLYKTIFDGSLDPDTLVPRMSMFCNTSLVRGRSAIILDEIQSCAPAYSSLKHLSGCGIDVIAMGSFLGINLEDDNGSLSPLGYVEIIRMYSMDFEEFLWAMGVNEDLICMVRDHIRGLKAIEGPFNKMFLDAFRTYMVVGGMPAAVKTYSETRDYPATISVLNVIKDVLMRDAGRYSKKAGRAKINACLRSIPGQIAREDKQFLYKDVEKRKGTGKRNYGNSLEWIENAGLSYTCHNLTQPAAPLSENIIEDQFKVFMSDTGLLATFMDGFDPADIVLRDPYSNHGAFAENTVCAELVRKGYTPYYYSKPDSTLEIDFVTRFKGKVALIEVKSGENRRSKSLNTLMAREDLDCIGIKLMETNIMKDDRGIVHLPLYAPCFFEDYSVGTIPEPDIDGMNSMFERLRDRIG